LKLRRSSLAVEVKNVNDKAFLLGDEALRVAGLSGID
jgi:hypothetical protein